MAAVAMCGRQDGAVLLLAESLNYDADPGYSELLRRIHRQQHVFTLATKSCS